MASDFPPKYFANRGVERNKRPLKNKVYHVTILKPSEFKKDMTDEDWKRHEKHKFKDEGYLILESWLEEKNPMKCWNGFITPAELKEKIGANQWAKFCQGKREFIVQRRVDGRNVKKNDKPKKLQTV